MLFFMAWACSGCFVLHLTDNIIAPFFANYTSRFRITHKGSQDASIETSIKDVVFGGITRVTVTFGSPGIYNSSES